MLQPGRAYSYDISIQTASETKTLKTLGLLNTGEFLGRHVEALGFEDNSLPSFALPPQEITDLRVVFGSCRRVYNDHLDAMVWIDDLMRDNPAYSYKDPLKRPHQLFLGGDQIYADDVDPVHLHVLMDLGKELIGTAPNSPNKDALERLMVDNVRKKKDDVTPDGLRRLRGQRDARHRQRRRLCPAGRPHALSGRPALPDHHRRCADDDRRCREPPALARRVRGDVSVGVEQCVLAADGQAQPGRAGAAGSADRRADPRDSTLAGHHPDAISARRSTATNHASAGDELSPFQNYPAYHDPQIDDKRTPEQKAKDLEEYRTKLKEGLQDDRERLTSFVSGLAKVRRVLANIPTYMIFDDHDVTDDWNLNPMWYDRVYTTSLGVTTIRNALVSYALVPGLGQRPAEVREGRLQAAARHRSRRCFQPVPRRAPISRPPTRSTRCSDSTCAACRTWTAASRPSTRR